LLDPFRASHSLFSFQRSDCLPSRNIFPRRTYQLILLALSCQAFFFAIACRSHLGSRKKISKSAVHVKGVSIKPDFFSSAIKPFPWTKIKILSNAEIKCKRKMRSQPTDMK